MFRFVVLALTISSALSYGGLRSSGFGGSLGLSSGFGGLALGGGYGSGLALGGGYGSGLALGGGYGRSLGPIPAAIQSTRSYEIIPVASNYEAAIPQTIEVGPNVQPVNFIFRTQSSPLNLQQIHTPAAPQYESTRSEDAPSVLTHDNFRTVVQQYNEVIQPIRKIQQRVNPVIEHVNTVVAKGEQLRAVAPAYSAPAPFLGRADYK